MGGAILDLKRILVFAPTYNEAGNIERLIDEVLGLGSKVEILIVDDHSPDGTGKIVATRSASNPRVHLLDRQPPRGRGLAGRDGFRWFQENPGFDGLIEMDADFSHHPRFIPALVAGLEDHDVVIGSRFAEGGGETGRSVLRQWTSRLANTYLRFVLRTRVKDCTSGFRAFSRRALDGIDFTTYRSVGPTIVSEVLFDQITRGRRITEVAIQFEDRVWGDSKLSLGILLRSLAFPVELRMRRCLGPRR